MSSKAVDLAIRMTADASDVESAFGSAGTAARAMADDVEAASRTTEAAAGGLDRAAESVDGVGSSASQAAGGLGDLGGALAMMPGPLGALGAGMESVAPAIQGVTGAADLANLALSSNVVQNTRAKAAAIASAVATKAQAVAARTAAAGQWILNAALAANPVGLVVIAVIALVAAVVLAYKKSETFRNVVRAVMGAVKGYVMGVVDVVTTLIGWVADKAPAAWEKLKGSAVGAAKYVADKVGGAFETVTAPIRAVIDLVQSLIDKISDIDFPDLPDIPDLNPFGKVSSLNPFGRATTPTTTSSSTAAATIDARTYVTIDGTGIVDEAAVARTLEPVLARQATRLGQLLTTTGPVVVA